MKKVCLSLLMGLMVQMTFGQTTGKNAMVQRTGTMGDKK